MREVQDSYKRTSVIDSLTGDVWTYQRGAGVPAELPVAGHDSPTQAQFAAMPTAPAALRGLLISQYEQQQKQAGAAMAAQLKQKDRILRRDHRPGDQTAQAHRSIPGLPALQPPAVEPAGNRPCGQRCSRCSPLRLESGSTARHGTAWAGRPWRSVWSRLRDQRDPGHVRGSVHDQDARADRHRHARRRERAHRLHRPRPVPVRHPGPGRAAQSLPLKKPPRTDNENRSVALPGQARRGLRYLVLGGFSRPWGQGCGGGHADGAGVGDDPGAGLGDRGEDAGQVRHRGRAEMGPGTGRGPVGGHLQGGVHVPARRGDRAVRAEPAPGGQPGRCRVPLLVGPAPDRLQVLAPQVQAAAQTSTSQPSMSALATAAKCPSPRCSRSTVAASQAADRVLRRRQRRVGRGQDPARAVQSARRPAEQGGGRCHLEVEPAEQGAQRADRPGLADPQGFGQLDQLPDPGIALATMAGEKLKNEAPATAAFTGPSGAARPAK